MRITIVASGFVLTSALRAYTERRLAAAVGWAGDHFQNLTVWLSDINGPRGGVDKRCKISLRLAGRGQVVIADTQADLYAAIDQAAGRVDRAVVRRVERKRNFVPLRAQASSVDDGLLTS